MQKVSVITTYWRLLLFFALVFLQQTRSIFQKWWRGELSISIQSLRCPV